MSLKVLSLLFLILAVSVGVILVSGKAALFVLPKAASNGAQVGDTCDKSNPECASGLRGVWKNGQCTCYSPPDAFCDGEPDGSMGCSDNKIVKCENNSKVTVQDCYKVNGICDVKNGGVYFCRIDNPGSQPKETPVPKKESGCGSKNYPACNSGTCGLGLKCQKSNGSCGCVKNSKK